MNRDDTYANAIAIIGMSGRFPGAADCDAFWENLVKGEESISFLTDEELARHDADYHTLKGNPNYVRARGVLDGIDLFDAGFFGFNPREASILDPQQRIWLESVWGALEDAGYTPEKYDGVIGLYAGGGFVDSYFLHNICRSQEHLHQLIHQRTPDAFSTILSNRMEFMATRTAHKLNLKGPVVNVQTGCSTSLVAVYHACQSLLNYDSDICLAGGVSVTVPQECGYLYQEGAITSPDGHCRPFDAKAMGTVFSSGVGVVVLKRMEEALEDFDNIIAVIKGIAINNDGSAKIGFAAPSTGGQAEVVAMAHAAAEVDPETISYVEAHGTATPLGDPIEVAALTKAFRYKTDARQCCGIGSVKSNIGHVDAASGVAGVIKTALALKNKQIPPTLHYERPNPEIDFENSPFYVVDRLTDWDPERLPRRAGVSSFGIGGTNAHAVLEEAPALPASEEEKAWNLILLSAKTETALEGRTDQLADYLEAEGRVNLGDVAYTLQVGRQDMAMRRAIVCGDTSDAISTIRRRDTGRIRTCHTEKRERPLVFMFSGQGSQYVNMGRGLYESEPVFKAGVDQGAEILKPHLGFDLRDLIFSDDENDPQATHRINQTSVTQPALFVMEYALAQLWKAWGMRPDAMIGHSIGEYVAATLAGVFSLEDALAIVATRGRLMQEMPGGSMRAIPLPREGVQPLLSDGVAIAAVNAPSLCVVSGADASIEAFDAILEEKQINSIALHTSHAFHSDMMEPVLAPFLRALERFTLQPPKVPFLSNVTGTWITEAEATNPEYWARQLREPVRFSEGIRELQKVPGRVLIEVGPGTALSTCARQHTTREADQTVISSLGRAKENLSAYATMLKAIGDIWLAGVQVDWRGVFGSQRRRRLPLPTYPFERKRHWVEPVLARGAAPEARADFGGAVASVPGVDTAAPEPVPEAQNLSGGTMGLLKGMMSELSGIEVDSFDDSVAFLEMGMDSLFLSQFSNRVKAEFGIPLGLRQLIGELSTFSLLAAYADASLSGDGAADTVQGSLASGGQMAPEERMPAGKEPIPGMTRVTRPPKVPLTSMQQRLWYIDQLDPGSPVYNLPFAFRFSGMPDKDLLRQSLNEIIRRHEALRTTFSLEHGVPVQVIAESLEIDLPHVDYRNLPKAEGEKQLAAYLEHEAARSFDLSKGPLVRAALVSLPGQEHVMLFMPHHIVFDGISFTLFQEELFELYGALKENRPHRLPELAVQYADYTVWQQEEWLKGEGYRQQLSYWKKQLAGEIPVLQLPADYPRPAEFSGRGATETLVVPEKLVDSLKRLAKQEGATVFMVFLAAFKTLMHRYSGQEDICVGSPFSNRVHQETESLIGFFTNTLVLRTACEAELPFADLLGRVKETCTEALNHQDMPFERLVQELNPQRDLSMTPLYQVMFVSLGEMQPDLSMAGIPWREEPVVTRVAQTDLMCSVGKTEKGMKVVFEYATDLFAADTIKRMLEGYVTLLEGIAANPEGRLAVLPLLTETERNELALWNDTSMDYPKGACIHELFEEQVEKSPDAPAVSFEGASLSYAELNRRAAAIANCLKGYGVGPEVFVGICVERSVEMLAGLLGILKAGGAYVPLDPEYPGERLAYMMESAQVTVLLTQQALVSKLPENNARIICIDTDTPPAASEGEPGEWKKPGPDNLAYVIFTSGSTGKPKGVQVPHGTVVNFLMSMAQSPGLARQDVMMAVTTLSFDIAVLELFLPLVVGARVVVAGREVASDGGQLAMAIERSEATFMQATPSTWRLLLAAGWKGAEKLKILCGGEAFPPDLAKELIGRTAEVWNMYGPTETTVWSTCCRLDGAGEPIPIGSPIANTQVHILGPQMRHVPVGVPGELYIGGDGVTRGYLNRPILTAERFVEDPFSERSQARLYRTGDLARYRPGGSIEYLGRLDNQVKVRGFRIEPGEIETLLTEHEAIRQCIVTVWADTPGDVRLVAHTLYEKEAVATGSELRKYLRTMLPDYMIPQHFIEVDRLPLTPAGKIDRKTLQSSFTLGVVKPTDATPPESENEIILAEIWREELGLSQVSVHDNFFDAGGHSLLAVRVIARVKEETRVELTPRDIFLNTLGQLAARFPFAGGEPPQPRKRGLQGLWSRAMGKIKN